MKKHNNKNDSQQSILMALSIMIEHYHLDIKTFCQQLKTVHIKRLYPIHQTVTKVALITGFDRRVISQTLKDNTANCKPPLLEKIIQHLATLASNQSKINKRGIDSVESAMHAIASGATTLKSIIDVLVYIGAIEIEDDGAEIKFVSNPLIPALQQCNALAQLSQQWHDSLADNIFSHQQIQEEKHP